MHARTLLMLAALSLTAPAANAQPPTGPAPVNRSYPGELNLQVDLRDATRQVFYVRETIPVRSGTLTLDYPEWIPGEHAPSGPIDNVTGLEIRGGGKAVSWRRDLLDMYKIHVTVPAGVSRLDLFFQFLSPTAGGHFGQSVSATPKLVALEWNQVAFYPDGYFSRDVRIRPRVLLPAGWRYATALQTDSSTVGGVIGFKAVGFNTLVDSPLIAGAYFKRIDLDPGAAVPVHLDLVADAPRDLEISDRQVADFRALVRQALHLFGSHHYDHYDFLFVLSDYTGHFGLEHHQSSDDRLFADYFTSRSTYLAEADVLPHEYTHSWNGKFRRPADLWTPNFNVPMKDDLLWVYEGLTNYWGDALAARSGLRTPTQAREALAATAAEMLYRPGRTWRPLQDTADEAQILYYAPRHAWANWRRRTDFYAEGELIWLDVDTKIRELTHERRSLDDFARRFYGIDNGSYVTKTYDFRDVVAALNAVAPYRWATFLRRRLDSTSAQAPLDGLRRGGWKLVFTDQPSEYFSARENLDADVNLLYSLGVDIDRHDGKLRDVLWGGPAFDAGLAPGMQIIAVNREKFSSAVIKDAIASAKRLRQPIRILARNLDYYLEVKIRYYGGSKYPHLERLPGRLDRMTAIFKAQ